MSSTKTVGELHALSVSNEFYHLGLGKASITLQPNPAFLSKVLPPGHINREMVLTTLSTSMPPGAHHVDVCLIICFCALEIEYRLSLSQNNGCHIGL
jgi:hypothetical protein